MRSQTRPRHAVRFDAQRPSSRATRRAALPSAAVAASVVAATSALLSIAPLARAADSSWTGPGNGVYNGAFQTSTNWSAGVPGPADAATFDLAQTYRVSFTADAANRALLVGGGGVVTLASATGPTRTYTVTDAAIADNSTLTLSSLNLKLAPGGTLTLGGNSLFNLTATTGSADLELDTLNLPGTPGTTARANLQGPGALHTKQIHVGSAANAQGSPTIAEVFLGAFLTVGAPTARTDLIVERGGHVLLDNTKLFNVGKTVLISGGLLDHRANSIGAGTLDFDPQSVMTIEQGGTVDLQGAFNGAAIVAHGAGNTLTFNGDLGSATGSVIDVADGAVANLGGNTVGHAEIHFSNGAIGVIKDLNIANGPSAAAEGHLFITGKGTVVSSQTSTGHILTIGAASGTTATAEVTSGGTLNADRIVVNATGTFTLDGGNLTLRSGMTVNGGAFRMTNAASLILAKTPSNTLSLINGANGYFSSGTVSGAISVASGATAFVNGLLNPANLSDASFLAAGGTINASAPLTIRSLTLGNGGLLSGTGSVTITSTFDLSGGTIDGFGDVLVGNQVTSNGTNSSHILGTRTVYANNGANLIGAYDLTMSPTAAIVNNGGGFRVDPRVRLIGGRFDNRASFELAGPGAAEYTSTFNNSGVVQLQSFGTDVTSIAFNGGGTHSGRFEPWTINPTGDYRFRFGGGDHAFLSTSSVTANHVTFDGKVTANLLGTITATDELAVTGAANVTAGQGARFDLAHAALNVSGNATFRIANPGFPPVTVGSLDVSDNGRLDLTRGAAIVNDTAKTALARVAAQVAGGYHNGAWSGPGILSSDAAADPTRYAVGYARANSVLAPGQTFFGQTVDPTAILIRFTLAGDATLDGDVDFNDVVKLAQGYNQPGDWSHGDFTYDGLVDFNDLVRLAQNYNSSLGVGAPTVPGASAAFESDLARAFASVPEPGPLAPLAAIAAFTLSRTRRTRRRITA